jgi:hypothetical protein
LGLPMNIQFFRLCQAWPNRNYAKFDIMPSSCGYRAAIAA